MTKASAAGISSGGIAQRRIGIETWQQRRLIKHNAAHGGHHRMAKKAAA